MKPHNIKISELPHRVILVIPERLFLSLKKLAHDDRRSLNNWLNCRLEEYIALQEEEE